MLCRLRSKLRKISFLRRLKREWDVLVLKTRFKPGWKNVRLEKEVARARQEYYVQLILDARCNFRCSYCGQSADGIERDSFGKAAVEDIMEYLRKTVYPREKNLSISGGEATLNPDFKKLIEDLQGLFFITVDTNLWTPFFRDFDRFISWAKDFRVCWNVTYHPEFADLCVFIEKVKKMKKAGLEMGWIAAVKTDRLPAEDRLKLESAGINFEYQTFFGIDEKTGELRPREYYGRPGFDYAEYVKMCGRKQRKKCRCRTIPDNGMARHFIVPDGSIYNCRHLMHIQKHPIGHVREGWPEKALGFINCDEYGFCDPCDFWDMEIRDIE